MAKRLKEKITVLGYGSQGRAIARNLHDSGADVLVGLRGRSKSHRLVKQDRLKSASLLDAVKDREIVIVATPDQTHAALFSERFKRGISDGATLVFLHGLSVHFELVSLPESVDITLLAPHAPGLAVREKFVAGERSISAFYAVKQDVSRQAKVRLFSLAEAIGLDRDRLLKTTFEHEAIGDIFGEQTVLCGGLAMLIKSGFETLVERGLKPDHAYLEVAYQLDLIIRLIKEHGIEGMLKRISVAARLGSVQNGPRIVGPEVKRRMKTVLKEIETGQFARQLADLDADRLKQLNRAIARLSDPRLERAAKRRA